MKSRHPWLHLRFSWSLAALIAAISLPVAAQESNFGKIILPSNSPQPVKISVKGYTGGSFSLSSISNQDRDKKKCFGFADPKPDHILVLEKDFDKLTVSIKSGSDTTLLIKGPDDNIIRCGDDTGNSKDASVTDLKWKDGTYRIWVGTFNPGVERNYTLTVQQ